MIKKIFSRVKLMKIFGDRKNKLLFAELLTVHKEHQKTSDNKLQQITAKCIMASMGANRTTLLRKKQPPDEFDYYFLWKADVENNTLPLPEVLK